MPALVLMMCVTNVTVHTEINVLLEEEIVTFAISLIILLFVVRTNMTDGVGISRCVRLKKIAIHIFLIQLLTRMMTKSPWEFVARSLTLK